MDDDSVRPGITPNTWHAVFEGGPMDGTARGILMAEPPLLIDWTGGRYRLLTKSGLPAATDLTGQHLLRGCRYGWEVESRAETPPLPGGRQRR